MVQGLLKKSKGKKPHAARKNGTLTPSWNCLAPKKQKSTTFSAKRNKDLTKVSCSSGSQNAELITIPSRLTSQSRT